jgi:hypothetical protein
LRLRRAWADVSQTRDGRFAAPDAAHHCNLLFHAVVALFVGCAGGAEIVVAPTDTDP